MHYYTIEEVREDWHRLDAEDFAVPNTACLVSHEDFSKEPGGQSVHYVAPGFLVSLFSFSRGLFNLLYAWRLLRQTKKDAVLILNGSNPLWLFVGLLNRYVVLRKRQIVLWDPFVEVSDGWKRSILRAATFSFRLIVVWSRKQIQSHADWLKMPHERFIYVPWKANHTKYRSYDIPIGNFVFSGGNGKRDYATLVEAVRDTSIPVVISATDATVRSQIEKLPNVIALAAWEPAFAQLQAASCFTVVPMIDTGLKAGGETNMLNGMSHGKPVIAADRMAAEDYIIEGVTGHIVPPGDVHLLRRRMLELWNDREKCAEMGRKAKEHVESSFTHEALIRRLLRVAKLCGNSTEIYTEERVVS